VQDQFGRGEPAQPPQREGEAVQGAQERPVVQFGPDQQVAGRL
jgi:hypothetical protein